MPVTYEMLERIQRDVEALAQERKDTLAVMAAHDLTPLDVAKFSHERGKMIWDAVTALRHAYPNEETRVIWEHAVAGMWTDGLTYGLRAAREMADERD
jgi:hypothetical protein